MVFVFGLLTGAALMALAFWLQRSGVVVKWYSWLLGILGFVLGLWAVNDFFASMAEHDERAGRVLLVLLGAPAVIFIALAIFLSWWGMKRARNPKAPAASE